MPGEVPIDSAPRVGRRRTRSWRRRDPAGGKYHAAAAGVTSTRLPLVGRAGRPAGRPAGCATTTCATRNVVFRGGERLGAIIDFDFAAPGRPVSDLAHDRLVLGADAF